MPAHLKDPSVRARRNRPSTKATLPARTLRSVEDFADLTVADLRARIGELNAERPADQQIPTRGTRPQLIERIIAGESPVPPMPEHPHRVDEDGLRWPVEWHPQTVAWWNDVWTSPMESQWDESDVHNVIIMALLYDDLWTATSAKERKEAAAEIRQQRADLGLAPLPRRRLEWTMETADEAKAKGEKRRGKTAPAQPPAPKGKDPRSYLTAVQ